MSLPCAWQPSKSGFTGSDPRNGAAVARAPRRRKANYTGPLSGWHSSLPEASVPGLSPDGANVEPGASPAAQAACVPHPEEVDPFYLFACHVEWERRAEPASAWELIAAARSSHEDTRAHARALLAGSREASTGVSCGSIGSSTWPRYYPAVEARMKVPYGLEIVDSYMQCSCGTPGFFCGFSEPVMKALDQVSHRSTLPAGAILFVEGQVPRGIFVLCSGKVKLSTTSREGKVLILKTAEAGEALGLSAAISGLCYEMTAETAMPCQVNFVDRRNLLRLIDTHAEVGMRASQFLSHEFQTAYRDIHELILARSSAGKLARLLLSASPEALPSALEIRLRAPMTHEEMAHRIGASRETVTRLLSELKRKQLIRLDGATLVIRNRPALEALAV